MIKKWVWIGMAGGAEWGVGDDELVHGYLQLEEPCHHRPGAYALLDSCVVSGALPANHIPVHVLDWVLELPLPPTDTALHGCQALSRRKYW